jgi:transcriptional regulator with XRE-family HTH domain
VVNDEADTDTAARRAIGEELRRARDTLGWTRAELAARLPFGVHVPTLAGYERGVVQCSSNRFIMLCQTMGVSAPDVLAWAMQRARIDLPTIGVQVDLHAVIRDKIPDLLPLRRWARKRLTNDPGTGIARLAWPAVQELATLLSTNRTEFVRTLILFTPRPVPQRR